MAIPGVRPSVTDDSTLTDFLDASGSDVSDGDSNDDSAERSENDGGENSGDIRVEEGGEDAGGEGDGDDTDYAGGEIEKDENEHTGGIGEGDDTEDRLENGAESRDSATDRKANATPLQSTYAWGEYTCSVCGGATTRVWRADEEFVCPACKPW